MATRTDTREPISYYLDLAYPVRFDADPDSGFVAVFPDLPGCMTQGETLEEAAKMAEDARYGWIRVEYERGSDIPQPSYPEEYSGKFNVRIPRSLHRSLATAAEDEGVSLNQYVVSLLSRGDAQARVERRLVVLEGDMHAIRAQLNRYNVTGVPSVSPEAQKVAQASRRRPSCESPVQDCAGRAGA